MAETTERRKVEIDPAAMPEGYLCAKCVKNCNAKPCVRFKIFYSNNMAVIEKCRASMGHREAVAMIREAYMRDFAEATGGGTNAEA